MNARAGKDREGNALYYNDKYSKITRAQDGPGAARAVRAGKDRPRQIQANQG